MGILGIPNRTENWKTAEYFAPFFESALARARLVNYLLGPSAETHKIILEPIRIELFWEGMRDYDYEQPKEKKVSNEKLACHYQCLFPDLREKVEQFSKQCPELEGKFEKLRQKNYMITNKNLENFCDNLRNTEIDIVLETQDHLFIGEAKDVSTFGADSSYVLVHQLIRQYVTARILLKLTQPDRNHPDDFIVPFLVVDAGKMDKVKNTEQVKFMCKQGWLKKENILSWDKIVLLG